MAKLTHKKRKLNKKMITRKKSRKVQRGGDGRESRTGVLINLQRIKDKNPNAYVLETENGNVFGPNPATVVKKALGQTMGQKMSRGFASMKKGASSMRGKIGSVGSSMKRGFSSIKDRFSRKKGPATAPATATATAPATATATA